MMMKLKTGRKIGVGQPTYIVAEIGSNHDGSLEKAKRLIGLAKEVGADAVKFQSFQAETLINHNWQNNGKWEKDPAWDTLENSTIPEDWHKELIESSNEIGIDFFSTPFDLERLKLLAEMDVPVIKIASGDLTYHEMLIQAGKLNKPIFLSTGHAHLVEVKVALDLLQQSGCDQVALLHCVSCYPTEIADSNIRAMVTLLEEFQVAVGYSDHTPGFIVSVGAVALGASIIEKHFTDDQSLPGPDHSFSLNPEEFSKMVNHIRTLEKALGTGVKTPVQNEEYQRTMARRGVYTKKTISKGNIIRNEDIKVVRHAYPEGIPANQLSEVLGRSASTDIPENTLLTWEML